MTEKSCREDFNQVKEYLKTLSEFSGNMSEAMVAPKKIKKGSEEKFETIVSQAIAIAESFSVMETLLKDIGMIKGMGD